MKETVLIYDAQPHSTLPVKGERYHGRYNDKMTLLLCYCAYRSEKLKSLVVKEFEKP
jgi:hypothetical protein